MKKKPSSEETTDEQKKDLHRFGERYEVLILVADEGLAEIIQVAINAGGCIISVEAQ